MVCNTHAGHQPGPLRVPCRGAELFPFASRLTSPAPGTPFPPASTSAAAAGHALLFPLCPRYVPGESTSRRATSKERRSPRAMCKAAVSAQREPWSLRAAEHAASIGPSQPTKCETGVPSISVDEEVASLPTCRYSVDTGVEGRHAAWHYFLAIMPP
jgi:hypothetical protein